MNKAELINAIKDRVGGTANDAEAYLNGVLHVIQDEVSKGNDVKIVDFGTFSRSWRKARTGRNPKNNTPVEIPACVVPNFKAGIGFKKKIAHVYKELITFAGKRA